MKHTDPTQNPRVLEAQTKELVTCAKQLGFAWKYTRDDYRSDMRWITLYRSDAPSRMRYQFEATAPGLEHLAAFLQEQGKYRAKVEP
jgi:hypothetical protein